LPKIYLGLVYVCSLRLGTLRLLTFDTM
jgi:hypothetical protein